MKETKNFEKMNTRMLYNPIRKELKYNAKIKS